ncbi:hypothetical protein [Flavobacterium adhaerens]|uniref:hypothetical protein n=1 Tax=Flavobacterium adhaerens TaxID=3149043 RepID=UPI0032B5A5E0
MKNKKTSLVNIFIDFFASLYDFVIVFFASLYDAVYDFIIFLGEYIKWFFTFEAKSQNDFTIAAKETVKINNQNPFNLH